MLDQNRNIVREQIKERKRERENRLYNKTCLLEGEATQSNIVMDIQHESPHVKKRPNSAYKFGKREF